MELTCIELDRKIRQLEEDINKLITLEKKTSVFEVATIEKINDCKPKYDFFETNQEIRDYIFLLAKLKHERNDFNLRTIIPNYEITIDEALAIIPLLKSDVKRLTEMSLRLPKEKISSNDYKQFIVYRYINYELDDVIDECNRISKWLDDLELTIYRINSTEKINIEL